MPTLLEKCEVPISTTVEGISLLSDRRRGYLHGKHSEGDTATPMVHNGRFKLIYYPVGDCIQLFDLQNGPCELCAKSAHADLVSAMQRLTQALIENLYGSDLNWLKAGSWWGLPDKIFTPSADRGLFSQRGWRFP